MSPENFEKPDLKESLERGTEHRIEIKMEDFNFEDPYIQELVIAIGQRGEDFAPAITRVFEAEGISIDQRTIEEISGGILERQRSEVSEPEHEEVLPHETGALIPIGKVVERVIRKYPLLTTAMGALAVGATLMRQPASVSAAEMYAGLNETQGIEMSVEEVKPGVENLDTLIAQKEVIEKELIEFDKLSSATMSSELRHEHGALLRKLEDVSARITREKTLGNEGTSKEVKVFDKKIEDRNSTRRALNSLENQIEAMRKNGKQTSPEYKELLVKLSKAENTFTSLDTAIREQASDILRESGLNGMRNELMQKIGPLRKIVVEKPSLSAEGQAAYKELKETRAELARVEALRDEIGLKEQQVEGIGKMPSGEMATRELMIKYFERKADDLKILGKGEESREAQVLSQEIMKLKQGQEAAEKEEWDSMVKEAVLVTKAVIALPFAVAIGTPAGAAFLAAAIIGSNREKRPTNQQESKQI